MIVLVSGSPPVEPVETSTVTVHCCSVESQSAATTLCR